MVGTISRLKPHLGLLPVLLIFVLVTGFTSLRAPLDTGPDEAVHFMFARFLKQEGYLPFTDEDRTAAGYKSDQPPLNALAVAAAYFWDDLNGPPYAKLTHDVHRRYLADNPDNFAAWRVLNTEDPIAGEFLFWYLGRWLSITFSTMTLIVIYFIAWAVFENAPKRQLWSLSVVISVAFIPTFILISSVFSYENLLGLWLSLYLLVAVYIVKKGGPAWLYFLEGLFIGLGMATKLSVLLAPVNLLIVVLFIGYRQRWLWRVWLTRLGLSLAGVLLGAGWWFALVISKFNRVEELGWLAGLIYPVLAGDGSDPTARQVITAFAGQEESGPVTWPDLSALLDWLRALFNTFWSLRLSIPVNIRPILVVVIIMIVVGLAWNWWRRRETRLWLTFFLFNISLFCILPLIRLVVTGPQTAKGHHIFFPAAGAFAILMVYGLGAWLPRRWETQWLGGMLLGLGLLSWSIVQSVQIYQTPLPVWTFPAAIPSSAKPIELDFGGIVLKGYELKGVGDAPLCCPAGDLALHLNLYWLTEEYLDQDYLTEVRLLDQQGKMQSIWLGHPADGRLPARAWEPGDYVRAEIWLPLAGLEAGPYSVKIRLLGRQGPLSVAGEEGYTLTNINLSDPVSLPNLPTTGETAIVDIWQHDTLYSYDLGGSTNYAMPVFPRRSTIQMSTRQAMRLELIGPDQVVRSPELAEGQRNVFVIDPRWPEGEYRLLAQPEDSPSFETEPVLFVDSQGRNTRPPDSQVKVDANFAGQLKLLGYNLPQRQFMPGEAIPVTLHFQAVQEMPPDFLMFNRLRDASGNVWAEMTADLMDCTAPSSGQPMKW